MLRMFGKYLNSESLKRTLTIKVLDLLQLYKVSATK